MHVRRDSLHPLHVYYVHIGMTLGFVMDVFIQTLLSHPQIPFGRKLGLLRALSKVMWIQNDLFARWYVRDGHELAASDSADTDSASFHSGRSNNNNNSQGGGGSSGSGTGGGNSSTNGQHHLAPNQANGGSCPYSGAGAGAGGGGSGKSDTQSSRSRQTSRSNNRTHSMYSDHSNQSNKALSEATTVAKREDEALSVSSTATAMTSNQIYRDQDTSDSSTSLDSKRSTSQLSVSSNDQLQQQQQSQRAMRRMQSSASRRAEMHSRREEEALNIPLVINNEFSTTQRQFEVRNPATGKLVGQCSNASVDDCNCAVQAAHAAFRVWSKLQQYARRDLMMRAADIMLSRKEELIHYQREETGAGRLFAEHTFMLAVSFLKDFASRIPSIEGSVPTVAEEGRYAMVIKEPYGVVVGVVPW